MAKKKAEVNLEGNVSITVRSVEEMEKLMNNFPKPLEIKSARIKDSFCNYSYELLTGPCSGDTINRSGASVIHEDMAHLFSKLKPHMALICEDLEPGKVISIDDLEILDPWGDYKTKSIEAKVIQFTVTSFVIDGTGENESVQLTGTKRLSTGEDLHLKAPKVKWEGDYPFVHELKAVIDDLRNEVEAYMNGKSAPKMVQQELALDGVEDTLVDQ